MRTTHVMVHLAALLTLGAVGAQASELTVSVTGIASAEGQVTFRVYQGKKDWLEDDGAVVEESLSLADWSEGKEVKHSFELPPGEYAVSVYHDEDGDDKLDSNFIGIPKEPAGLSNKPKARMGPPKYADAAFELPEEGLAITVEVE